MKIIIFGSTGPSGILTLTAALKKGHHVVAYARNPSKISYQHPNLKIIKGELSDVQSISDAIKGTDAVISLLGPKGKSESHFPLAQGTRNVIAAMKTHGVKRLIATATPSAPDPNDNPQPGFSIAVFMIRTLMRSAYDEIVSIAGTIRNSNLNWTIVRLPMLTDKPQKNKVTADYLGNGKVNLFWLNRNDLADFLIDQLDSDSFVKKAPVLSN
jgi:nucleoside-diphosphate-sugar epimerase